MISINSLIRFHDQQICAINILKYHSRLCLQPRDNACKHNSTARISAVITQISVKQFNLLITLGFFQRRPPERLVVVSSQHSIYHETIVQICSSLFFISVLCDCRGKWVCLGWNGRCTFVFVHIFRAPTAEN